jgi:propanol-preferring alcohol dehydrogenase
VPHECSVASPYWVFITELIEVVSLAQTGKIQMLVEHFPLKRTSEAYSLLHNGKIQRRGHHAERVNRTLRARN